MIILMYILFICTRIIGFSLSRCMKLSAVKSLELPKPLICQNTKYLIWKSQENNTSNVFMITKPVSNHMYV